MKFLNYILRFVRREIQNNKRFTILFILNLSLGLTGFIALDGFKESLDRTIKTRSKGILGADFGISARRPILENELESVKEKLPQSFEESKMIELYSMVSNLSGRSKLMQLKAIESNFPFYGEIELNQPSNSKDLENTAEIWVYEDILHLLKVKLGDKLRIGTQEFSISRVVTRDSAAGVSTNMAPRIYLHINQLMKTGLIRPGSVAWHSYVFKIPYNDSEELNSLRDGVFKSLPTQDIRVYTHENTSQQMTRMLSRLNDFLGLTSLVALFLAALGSGFLFRSYFKKKIKEIAILISLGMSKEKSYAIYLTQIMTLGFLSSLLATVLSLILVPGLGEVTKSLLPFPIEFSINLQTVLLGILVGTLGSFLICLPVISNLKDIRPAILLSESQTEIKQNFRTIITSLPVLLFFWIMAIILSKSYQIGSLFMGSFVVSAALLAGTSWFFFSKLNLFKSIKSNSLRWALRDLNRNTFTTFACFISIGLGTLLLNLIPQIQASLDQELRAPEKSKVPSLFIFDIQEEQLETFKTTVKKSGADISLLSPMVRARLKSVNGKDFDKGNGASAKTLSREEQREMRFRNRGFNLSYRKELHSSEKLYAGKYFSGVYDIESDKLPEISLERRFASRLGLKIGDKLTFDIESIPVEGVVIGLRDIRWTSFQPNFFIQFQPGVLEMAPKTFIATLPSMSQESKEKIQDTLVDQLPNITMINVTSLVERISSMMNQMAWALKFMSLLCLLAGMVVIYSIANHQARSRRWDIGLLKSLGAGFQLIKRQFLWQFAIISFLATALGAIISLAVSFGISSVLFEGVWAFDITTPIITILGCIFLTLGITNLAITKALNTQTRELFHS